MLPGKREPVAGAEDQAAESLVGTIVGGKYRVAARLGDERSLVFEAIDRDDGTKLALKVVGVDLRAHAAAVDRFRREAAAIVGLEHENLVPCLAWGVDEGLKVLYTASPLLEGVALDQALRPGPPDVERGLTVARQILSGLEAIHLKNLVHGGLKPANVFLERTAQGPVARLLDLGLVRGSTAGKRVGMPVHVSPEQLSGKGRTALSDVYAAGSVVYEILAGRPAFSAESPGKLAAKHFNEAPSPGPLLKRGVPEKLAQVVIKALAKDPEKRHGGAHAFAAALEEASGRPGARTPLPAKSPTPSGSHPKVDLAAQAALQPPGTKTKPIRVPESLRDPKVTPMARPREPGPEGGPPTKVVGWLWCDPLPPFALGSGPVVKIGRADSSDIVLPHPSVSRVHAVVFVSGEKLILEDRSTLGTYVNGSRVSTGPVAPGDNIVIGPYEIKVCAAEGPLAPKTASDADTRSLALSRAAAVEELAMAGRLDMQPLAEVLQALEFNQRSGTLVVEHKELSGEIVVIDGMPVRASLGPLLGEVAVHAMLSFKKGAYAFKTAIKASDRNLSRKFTAILLDASRNQDEEA